MVLDSEKIKEKAENFRPLLTETEARIAEGLFRGLNGDAIKAENGISEGDYREATAEMKVAAYFWILVALSKAGEAELYGESIDIVRRATESRQRAISLLSGTDTVH